MPGETPYVVLDGRRRPTVRPTALVEPDDGDRAARSPWFTDLRHSVEAPPGRPRDPDRAVDPA